MRLKTLTILAVLGLLLIFGIAYAQQPATGTGRAPTSAEAAIADWPEVAKKAAQDTIKKYGPPQEVTHSRLIWWDNGPWKQTIVFKREIDHNFPMPHKDALEQFVDYRVPPDKFDELAEYDGSVIVERTVGEFSARCDKEAMNFLALNLANDIVTGKRSVDEARDFYAKTAMDFKQGKQSNYTQGLLFGKMRATADPDQQHSPERRASR